MFPFSVVIPKNIFAPVKERALRLITKYNVDPETLRQILDNLQKILTQKAETLSVTIYDITAARTNVRAVAKTGGGRVCGNLSLNIKGDVSEAMTLLLCEAKHRVSSKAPFKVRTLNISADQSQRIATFIGEHEPYLRKAYGLAQTDLKGIQGFLSEASAGDTVRVTSIQHNYTELARNETTARGFYPPFASKVYSLLEDIISNKR